MYLRVRLLNGFKELLTYKMPDSWSSEGLRGSLIEVPLQKRTETGLVEDIFPELAAPVTYTIRDALTKDIIPHDQHYFPFLAKLSDYYAIDQLSLLKRLRSFLKEKEHAPSVAIPLETRVTPVTHLTPEQESIVQSIIPAITQGIYYPALLHGVTGSGKTEIYKKLILHAWHEGKSSLFLFPEVSLAVRFAHLLKQQMPQEIALFSFHSAVSIKEKRLLWQHLMENKPVVIIGVHLPILLPIGKLGLIILDEEHDVGFQEKKHPKINTKEAALLRAQISSIPLIAGSATPSITSFYNVETRGWHLFELKKRFAGSFPQVTVVKLTEQKKRKHFWISEELEQALKNQLLKKEQAIIFLNRRGYSFFVQCKKCGFVPHCTNCSVSLTLHNTHELLCHYCNFHTTIPESCTSCSHATFLKQGIGTQQVVTILEKMFPQAKIARADLDSTIDKKKWTQTLNEFSAGTIDILIGTQTITKGFHFPGVTLVGILWADINLSLPLYNAAEVTLQQLIQVSGRAGRQSEGSRVIVQTMLRHPIFDYISETNYKSFYTYEIKKREQVHYPPSVRFFEIELKHTDESTVDADALSVARTLRYGASHLKQTNISVLGPTEPPVPKIKNIYSRKIYIKSESIGEMLKLYRTIDPTKYVSSIFFTPNPLS